MTATVGVDSVSLVDALLISKVVIFAVVVGNAVDVLELNDVFTDVG